MKQLKMVKGDLFAHLPTDSKFVIPHIVNDLGIMGSGFVIPLKRKFPQAEIDYVNEHKKWGLPLGDIVWTKIDNGYIANMIAQRGMISKDNPKPIRYGPLSACMDGIAAYIMDERAFHKDSIEILAPKFGSVRAGGNWDFILELIEEIWLANDIDVTIFEYEEKPIRSRG